MVEGFTKKQLAHLLDRNIYVVYVTSKGFSISSGKMASINSTYIMINEVQIPLKKIRECGTSLPKGGYAECMG